MNFFLNHSEKLFIRQFFVNYQKNVSYQMFGGLVGIMEEDGFSGL